jgi:ATP-binding cassette subfamily C (CFTR/MRP) protein 1
VSTGSSISAGMVGLAMSYALQITQSLNWIVRQTVEVETNIVSVERVLEYARLKPEAAEVIHRNRPPISWPASGGVQFNNYSTRYREGLDLVLKNINLDIKPHEKIGVVGRTGAGKSSLTLSLFRIIEPASGNISIDALSTSTIGLLDLRRRLAIIPQDAALFEGSIRDNLDPGHVHDDTELWSVLGKSVPFPSCVGCNHKVMIALHDRTMHILSARQMENITFHNMFANHLSQPQNTLG